MYWGLFEMNCWDKRSGQIAKGEFLEVPLIFCQLTDQAVQSGPVGKLPAFFCAAAGTEGELFLHGLHTTFSRKSASFYRRKRFSML